MKLSYKRQTKNAKSRYVSRFLQCSEYRLGNDGRTKIHLVVHVFERNLYTPLGVGNIGAYRSEGGDERYADGYRVRAERGLVESGKFGAHSASRGDASRGELVTSGKPIEPGSDECVYCYDEARFDSADDTFDHVERGYSALALNRRLEHTQLELGYTIGRELGYDLCPQSVDDVVVVAEPYHQHFALLYAQLFE